MKNFKDGTEMAKPSQNMTETKHWYAIYTKPRWEKKVHARLLERGIESYCPLNKVRKQWSDRVKLVEEPLFKSYVFVHISPDEESRVRMVEGVLNFVYWQGKPARIRESEMDNIQRFLNEYEDVKVESLDLKPESRVVIRAGLMMNREAIVRRIIHHKVEVMIESLGCKIVAQFDRQKLQSIIF
jgi:transcription antitermination factor NusG